MEIFRPKCFHVWVPGNVLGLEYALFFIPQLSLHELKCQPAISSTPDLLSLPSLRFKTFSNWCCHSASERHEKKTPPTLISNSKNPSLNTPPWKDELTALIVAYPPSLWLYTVDPRVTATPLLCRCSRAVGPTPSHFPIRNPHLINPFTPESDQCQISPAASPEIWHHTVRRTWLFIAYSDEKWLYYKFSLHHSYNRFLKGWENTLFELRSERVNMARFLSRRWP